MKKIILGAFLLMTSSLVLAQNTLIIKGDVQNLEEHQLVIAYRNSEKQIFERLTPVDGKFEVNLTINQEQEIEVYPYRYYLNSIQDSIRKFRFIAPKLILFVAPGDQLSIRGDAMKFWHAQVQGGKYANAQSQLRTLTIPYLDKSYQLMFDKYELLKEDDSLGLENNKEALKLLQSKEREAVKQFFTENNNSELALYKLYQHIRLLPIDKTEEIFLTYSPELQQSNFGKKILAYIEKSKAIEVGAAIIDFEGRTLNGKVFNTKDLRGKYLLLDFWGSWCVPCRKSNPHLKELYAQYNSKGFEILGIAHEMGAALEDNKKSLQKAVEKDGLPWPQLLNNEMAKKFDVVKAFNVSGFPTKLLIDPRGKIIWKSTGLKADGLDEILKKVML